VLLALASGGSYRLGHASDAPSAWACVTGEVPERSIGAVSKTVVPLRVPRVRIPASPPASLKTTRIHHIDGFAAFFGLSALLKVLQNVTDGEYRGAGQDGPL
jgi:hypothetical protein